jgi:phosphoglycerate dehydrogenase-like enzyme
MNTKPLCTELGLELGVLADKADVELVYMDDPEVVPDPVFRADGLIVAHYPKISAKVLRRLFKVRVIVRNGVGFDNVDTQVACELGIPVCNVPDYGTEEVADHALTFTLALVRRLSVAAADVRAGNWVWQVSAPVPRIRGQVFGVVGCGRIGTAAALRAKSFGFRVLFFDPYLPSGYEKAIGVGRCATLRELLQISDVVSLHAPLTEETRGMIGESEFAVMKRGSVLVNTARGPLVREQALLTALRAGALAGAALDVLEREPRYDPAILEQPNCIITPHMAFYSEESLVDMRTGSARTTLIALEGALPPNIVNGVTQPRAVP